MESPEEPRPPLTHLDDEGRLRMVDVSGKEVTFREACAEGRVSMAAATLERIAAQAIPKGNVYEVARVAGIMAAKRTAELIPLCHPLRLSAVEVHFVPEAAAGCVKITSRVRAIDRTGVEMEALVAVTHAALTLYDMCKAIDRDMTIRDVRLTFKSGGRSGIYRRREG
jgi:cyclic pyranopterin phosphate synthase